MPERDEAKARGRVRRFGREKSEKAMSSECQPILQHHH